MNLRKGMLVTLIGLFLGAALAAFLGQGASSNAIEGQYAGVSERQATIRAMGLGQLVGAWAEGEAEPAVVQQLAVDWVARHDDVLAVRVLSGRNLLASTLADDLAGDLPRRLKRPEKDFFDLARELKAGISTNAREEVYRKDELSLITGEDGNITVTAPYLKTGSFNGVVEVVVQPGIRQKTLSFVAAVAMFMFASLLFLVYGAIIPEGSLGKREKWADLGVASALVIFGLTGFATGRLEAYREHRLGYESEIAEYFKGTLASAGEMAGQHAITFASPTENTWDTDEYRRPLDFVSADGSLKKENITATLAENIAFLKKAFAGNGFVGWLVVLFFGMGWASRTWRALVEHRAAYGFVTPAMLGMLVLVFFPFFYGLALSFTGQTLYNTDKSLLEVWVGLRNYIEILGDFNLIISSEQGWSFNYQNFYWTLFITICWTVCNVVIGVSVGLGLALALNHETLKGKPIYRAILILPWAIPNYVTALIWKGLFHKQFGAINQVIELFGGEPIAWFDSVFTSFITGITVNGWLSFPFMMVICLGALQSVSKDMYEAARLDGASRFQQFRYITLPSLKPTLIPAIIISVVWTFNMFNIIYLVSGGEPVGANEILVTQAYKIAFQKYQYGYAAAYATVIFMILLGYGFFQTKMTKATEDIAK